MFSIRSSIYCCINGAVLWFLGISREFIPMIDCNDFISKCIKLNISGWVKSTYVPELDDSFLNVDVFIRPKDDPESMLVFTIQETDEHFDEWLECFYRAENVT